MTTTARNTETYLEALVNAVSLIDPNLDVQKGPLSVLMYGFSVEGSRTENQATYLQSLYQLTDPELIRDEDFFELGLNFGKDANTAQPSRGTVYFYVNTAPTSGETFRVSEGYVVSSSDGRFNYTATEEAEMTGETASAYYNATEKRYEIPVSVEAVAVGDDFNLPPNAINVIQTVQDDWDGVINKDYIRRGTDPLDKFQFRDLLWDAMQGLSQNAVGNIVNIIGGINPTGYDDLSLITSTDFSSFARLSNMTEKMGYDVYLISSSVRETSQRGVASGGETFIPFDRKPVLSVVFVSVDGVEVPFSFDADTSDVWRGSPRANDRVQLSTALQPAQTYEVRYLYYDVVFETDEVISGRPSLFGSDGLIRLADQIEVYIEASIQAFATAETEDVLDDLRLFTQGYFRDPEDPGTSRRTFVSLLDPSDYQKQAEAQVDGLTQLRITRFGRLDQAFLDVEAVTMDGKTQYPVLSVNSIFTTS